MGFGLVYPEKILRRRIESFFELLPENSVVVIISPPHMPRNQDVDFRYRPSSRVLYLMGIADPDIKVVFRKGNVQSVSVFRKKIPYEQRVWIGDPTPDEEIKKVADEIYDLSSFEEQFEKVVSNTKYLLYPIGESERTDSLLGKIYDSLKKRSRAGTLPPSRILDIDFILGRMRLSKDDYEISLIKRAVSLTKMAIHSVQDMIKEGVFEYEIDAHILGIYRKAGGWEAFPTIVASGKNSVILHYMKNSSPIKSPCIVDTGAEINFYASDITRTFVFDSSGIKERNASLILDEVIKIQKKVIENVREGVKFSHLNELAQKLITQFLIEIGLLKGTLEENFEKKRFRAFFPHRIGHHLGLDVHDNCLYYDEDGNEVPLPEGAIITVEPGIYIPDAPSVFLKDGKVFLDMKEIPADEQSYEEIKLPPELRGIGVRWEDDVLVKNEGAEVL